MTPSPTLKQRTIRAIAWTGAIQLLSQIINFALSILLARLLAPEDFGLVAMVLIFIGFSQLLCDFGLSAALIQKKSVTKQEAFSCFVFNCLLGFTFTLLLYTCRDSISSFYNDTRLIEIVSFIAPIFIISSASSVPKAMLARELHHKQISLIEMTSMIAGTIVALIMAINDFGFWSLIYQQIVNYSLKSLMLIIASKLTLTKINFREIKKLFGFSANVFSTQVLQQISLQADKVIIGKFLSATELGLYSRAFHLTTFPIKNVSTVIASVMFPALSKIKNNPDKVGKIYLRAIGLIALVTFPILAGFAVLSEPIINFLLGEKWLPMQKFLIFFSLIGMIVSIATITGSFYLSQGRADLQLKINLVTQPLQIVLLLVGIQYGIDGLLVSYALSKIIAAFVTWYTLSNLLNLTVFKILNQLTKPFISTIAMSLAVYFLNQNIVVESSLLEIIMSAFVGSIVFILFNLASKNNSLYELMEIVLPKFKKGLIKNESSKQNQ